MSVIMQFNCSTHNEAAKKVMESYTGILQKAFEHYQNLLEDYIKLQEKYEQCNSQVTSDTPCTEPKSEATPQKLISTNVRESNSISLLESNTLNVSSTNFNSDTDTNPLDASEPLSKDNDKNNPPKSPVFFKTFRKIGGNSARKLVRSLKAVDSSPISNMKKHHSIEKVSSKSNCKLEISTTRHVETTILPNGKRLKQSRLVLPVKSNEKMIFSSSVDKQETASILHNIKQNCTDQVSAVDDIANATVTENDTPDNTSEISEDVIEISPSQRNIMSKVKRLKLKRKIPSQNTLKISPKKNKRPGRSPSVDPEIIVIDCGGLYFSPKHTSTQVKEDKFLTNIAVNTLKDKVNTHYISPIKMHNKTEVEKSIEAPKEDCLLTNKAQNLKNINAYEDKTYHLPSNRNNMDNLNLDDIENKPLKKKMISDKFKLLPKRKADLSEHFNMRCKADRAKLKGLDCWECREYYKNLSLSEEELQKRMNQCSRHRYKYERPNTPEGFWDPEFPETLSSTYRQSIN